MIGLLDAVNTGIPFQFDPDGRMFYLTGNVDLTGLRPHVSEIHCYDQRTDEEVELDDGSLERCEQALIDEARVIWAKP